MPEFTDRCVPDPEACSCPGHGPGGWNVHHVAPCCGQPHTADPEREKAMRLELAVMEQRLKEIEQDREQGVDRVKQYNPQTGQWEDAVPIPVQGVVAKVEFWLRDRGFKRLPNLLAWWDERALG